MATITDHNESPSSLRNRRLLWFIGLWLASVLAVLAACEILRLVISALYSI